MTNGGCRDTDALIKQKVPVYSRCIRHGIRPGRVEVGGLNIPVNVGGWAMGEKSFGPIAGYLGYRAGSQAWVPPEGAGIGVIICGVLLRAAIFVTWGLVLGFVVSYLCTAATIDLPWLVALL